MQYEIVESIYLVRSGVAQDALHSAECSVAPECPGPEGVW